MVFCVLLNTIVLHGLLLNFKINRFEKVQILKNIYNRGSSQFQAVIIDVTKVVKYMEQYEMRYNINCIADLYLNVAI